MTERMEKRIISDSLIEEYCSWMYGNEKSGGTIKKYSYYLNLFKEFLNDGEVEKEKVLLWKSQLRDYLAPVTVNTALAAINGFFKYKGWGECMTRFIKIKKNIFCPEKKELSREEYVRLVKTARDTGNERLELLIQTLCSTGIRISELRYITVEAVEKGMMQVDCKGRVRTVFLTEGLCDMLKIYAGKLHITTGMIFITRGGKPLDRSNIWRDMKKLGFGAKVEWEKIYPHNLRHLFARTYYNQEKDLNKLSDILGHSDINTTRIYTMESGQNHLRQIEKMNLLVGNYNGISLLL